MHLAFERGARKGFDEKSAALGHARARPEVRTHRHLDRRELEPQFDRVFGAPGEDVDDHPVPGLDEEHPPPVEHWIGEAAVGIVRRLGGVEALGGLPVVQPRPGSGVPLERPDGDRLPEAVHHDGAVGRRAAEEVAPSRLGGVAIGPRIDEAGASENGALDTEQIGVAVPRAERTAQRPNVENELMGIVVPSAPHHDEAAVGEEARGGRGRRRGTETLERLHPVRSQQPRGLRRQASGRPRVVGAAEQGRRRREYPPKIVRLPGREREQPAAVGIPDRRHRAVGAAEGNEDVDQPLDPLSHRGGDGHAVPRGKNHEMEVGLDRVSLIARGLLEVDAVR